MDVIQASHISLYEAAFMDEISIGGKDLDVYKLTDC